MSRRSAGGDALLQAFEVALSNLDAHVDAINALNVFPVPDGDTGSNMLATMRAAVAEARALPAEDRSAGAVSAAISYGALMGSRGNSGVILSQVLRGMSEALAGRSRMGALDLAHALTKGSQTADAAVVRPVEGTILTVVREAAAAAVLVAEHEAEPDLEAVLGAAVEAAELAVQRTPSLLPVLREAGVVDAGGEGLYRFLQGALRGLIGAEAAVEGEGIVPRAAVIAQAEGGFGYETMFLVNAHGATLDIGALRAQLESLGDSVLVAGDARMARVHVHTQRPDEVLGIGLSLGTLSGISVENLDRQALQARQSQARGLGLEHAHAAVHGHPVHEHPAEVDLGEPMDEGFGPSHGGPAIVAVTTGDGLETVFRSFGISDVIRGGQGENPSTGEILQAVARFDGRDVLVLPNNPNVKLAAEQAASLRPGSCVLVVPTRNAAEGFAALLAFEPSHDAQTNAAAMLGAAQAIQTLQVTEAVRDARIGDRKVRKGQTIVLDPDDGLVGAGNDRTAVVLSAIGTLRAGFELLTVYYGDGADLAEAEELSSALLAAVPGVEVELVRGGQPHYRYLISAE